MSRGISTRKLDHWGWKPNAEPWQWNSVMEARRPMSGVHDRLIPCPLVRGPDTYQAKEAVRQFIRVSRCRASFLRHSAPAMA